MTVEKDVTTPDKNVELAIETLMGDTRDVLLTHIRSMETPWSKMSEAEQAEKIGVVTNAAKSVVSRATQIVARQGFDHMPMLVKKFTVEGGKIKGNIEAHPTVETISILADHLNQAVLLVLCDPDAFMGESQEAKPDPDEPELELPEGDEDPDAGEGDAGDEAEATEEEPSPATDSEAPGDGDADDGDPTAPEASPDTEQDNETAGDEPPAAGGDDGEASATAAGPGASPSEMPDVPPSLDRREEATTAG